MKRYLTVLLMVICLVISGVSVFAYESDRMDFGNIDFKGETVTIVGHWNEFEKFMEGGTYAGRLEEAKKKFNIGEIKFNIANWQELNEVCMSRYLSGDSDYDIWRLHTTAFWRIAATRPFYDLTQVLPDSYWEKMPEMQQQLAEVYSLGGEKYTYSLASDPFNQGSVLVWNKDLAEKLGVGDLSEYYKNDNWNWNTFEEVLRKATQDLDNDGEIDVYGLSQIRYDYFVITNGGSYIKKEDGHLIWGLDDPKAIKAYDKVYQWLYVDKLADNSTNLGKFLNGEFLLYDTPLWRLIINADDLAKENISILPYPKGPDADQYYFPMRQADQLMLPKNSAYPEGMVALDNFLFPLDEYQQHMKEDLMGIAFDEISYEVLMAAAERGVNGYMYQFLSNRPGDMKSGQSGAAAMAESKPAEQAKIDEMYNQ